MAGPLPSHFSAMRVDLFFLTIAPFITLGLSATVVHRPPPQPQPSPLPSHLQAPTTFYRAVTGDQVTLAPDIYPIGKAPTTHRNTSSDFSQIGALYVFAVRERALIHHVYHHQPTISGPRTSSDLRLLLLDIASEVQKVVPCWPFIRAKRESESQNVSLRKTESFLACFWRSKVGNWLQIPCGG